ncbi:DUF4279 domain-containing protein [Rossellomorea aquimaris]|uniref:DUF4279 domain-containing protein n=1 Tax=Rossellomorea aquimaris TaxID=189382 RepID=UPI001CD573F4|nr:DUF4279 domain-containing protein [Rossellomorea aquimaris]MCA1060313.1 DUF4279 domain-containing protein [Rossellomorea aquimaris]
MNTEINVEFCLYGDELNPDDITESLELVPSLRYKKGDLIKEKGTLTRVEGCWEIETGYAPSLDINDALVKMKDILHDKKEKIIEIKRAGKLGCRWTIVIKVYEDDVPGMHFSSSMLSFIVNDLEAEMDICQYVIREESH